MMSDKMVGMAYCMKCSKVHPPGTECPAQCSKCGYRHYPDEPCLQHYCPRCFREHYLGEPCQRHVFYCAICGYTHWDDEQCPRLVLGGVRFEDNLKCDVCAQDGDESPKMVLSFRTSCIRAICMKHLRQAMEMAEKGKMGVFFPCKNADSNG